MTSTQFAAYIRLKTQTDSNTLTDADILTLANVVKDDIAKEVLKSDEDYFGMFLYRDLEDDRRKYLINDTDTDLLSKIKYFEAKLDGSNWERLTPSDINTLKFTSDEETILSEMANLDPVYLTFGGEIIIFSDSAIIDVTRGLKMWAILYPADLSALNGSTDMSKMPSSTTFGMPRQLHKVWADKVIIEWKGSKKKPIPLTEREKNWEYDLEKAINSLKSINLDEEVIPTVPYDDGQDY